MKFDLAKKNVTNVGRWAFLDVETTGMNLNMDRVIQISVVYQPLPGETYSYSKILYPGNIIETNWWAGSVISKDTVRDAKYTWIQIAKDIAKIFRSCDYVVAHNATFDRNFVYQEMNKARVDFDDIPWFCTMRAAQQYIPGERSYKLADVANYLNIAWQGEAHNAENDTLMVQDIWFKMLQEFPELRENLAEFIKTKNQLPLAKSW